MRGPSGKVSQALVPRQSSGQLQTGCVRGSGEGQTARKANTQSPLAGNTPRSREGGGGWRGHKEWPEMGSFGHAVSLDGNNRKKWREEEN